MSENLQKDLNHYHSTEYQLWQLRWFLVRFNAVMLALSIPLSVAIAIFTKFPLPETIPGSLSLSMMIIVRWAFHKPPEDNKTAPLVGKAIKRIRSKANDRSEDLPTPSS